MCQVLHGARPEDHPEGPPDVQLHALVQSIGGSVLPQSVCVSTVTGLFFSNLQPDNHGRHPVGFPRRWLTCLPTRFLPNLCGLGPRMGQRKQNIVE
jgi:hypothetical protein